MDTFPLAAGTSLTLETTIADSSGLPISYPAPGPALAAEVWPGGSRAESFAVAVQWMDVSQGVVRLSILATQTAGLAGGRYRGQLVITDPALGPVIGYEFAIEVAAQPGTQPEPLTYCSYDDLLRYGRSWLPSLATDDDEAGFAEQRGRARSWLDDMIVAAYPNRYGRGYGLPFGGWGSSASYIRSMLDSNQLILRGWVIEATAKKALSLVCETQVGPGTESNPYQQLGRQLAADSRRIVLARSAEFSDGSGGVRYTVNLAGGSIR